MISRHNATHERTSMSDKSASSTDPRTNQLSLAPDKRSVPRPARKIFPDPEQSAQLIRDFVAIQDEDGRALMLALARALARRG